MYPFATNRKEYFFSNPEGRIKECLEKKIQKKRIFQITSDKMFYGKVKTNFAIFELGQFPSRNAWRPIIKLEWTKCEGRTKVGSTYSLDKLVYLLFATLPIFGLYISIQEKIFVVLAITTAVYLVLVFGIFRVIYNNSMKKTTELLEELINRISIEKQT